MYNPFQYLENIGYIIRDAFWNYPNVFSNENIYFRRLKQLYNATSPYSHFSVAILFSILLIFTTLFGNISFVITAQSQKLVEGIIVGEQADGTIQSLSKIDPLNPTSAQLEKDIINLIYEPLYRFEFIKVDEDWASGIENILTQDIIRREQGADYEFILKRNIYWHSTGSEQLIEFTADDVVRTFTLVASLDENNSSASRALNQLFWEKIDSHTVRVCTRPIDELIEISSCDDIYTKPILSNFLELLSFSIIPAHYSQDIDLNRLEEYIPALFRSPIGTGPYQLSSVSDSSIILSYNELYHKVDRKYAIDQIEFKFYKDLESAIAALTSGEIHTLSSISTEYISIIDDYPQIDLYKSPILYKQFWALYFNLKTNFEGTELVGNKALGDERVRKAIAAAINKDFLIEEGLSDVGEKAQGPIPVISEFFNPETDWVEYRTLRSEQLLNQAGWTLKNDDEYRTNNEGHVLAINLFFVGGYDRNRLAEIIKQDLKDIGIKLVIDRREQVNVENREQTPQYWTLKELNEQILAPRQFDMLLYGMETFIDPDRFELYHSSQSIHPGLNIASYQSTELTVQKRDNKQDGESSLEDVPKVDRWLELARSFDPVEEKEARKERYFEVQNMIANDTPVIYLFHPQFLYFSNNDISNVVLDNVTSLENRFRNIHRWDINN